MYNTVTSRQAAGALGALFDCCWVAGRGSVSMGGNGVPTGVMGCDGGAAGALTAHFGCWWVAVLDLWRARYVAHGP